jgi:hypothetical protein
MFDSYPFFLRFFYGIDVFSSLIPTLDNTEFVFDPLLT